MIDSVLEPEPVVADLVIAPPQGPPQARFLALAQWEGTVTEVTPDSFIGRVCSLDRPGVEEEAEFDLAEVSDDDRGLVVAGGVFYWSIGYRVEPQGQRSRCSVLRFRRLPAWSARDIQRNGSQVKDLRAKLGL